MYSGELSVMVIYWGACEVKSNVRRQSCLHLLNFKRGLFPLVCELFTMIHDWTCFVKTQHFPMSTSSLTSTTMTVCLLMFGLAEAQGLLTRKNAFERSVLAGCTQPCSWPFEPSLTPIVALGILFTRFRQFRTAIKASQPRVNCEKVADG